MPKKASERSVAAAPSARARSLGAHSAAAPLAREGESSSLGVMTPSWSGFGFGLWLGLGFGLGLGLG